MSRGLDVLWLVPVVALVLAMAAVQADCPPRLDELYTLYALFPSPAQTLAVGADNLNTMPPLYFLLAAAWTGGGAAGLEVARWLSTLAMAAAAAVAWFSLRRWAGAPAAAVGVAAAYAGGEFAAQHVAEARPYALLALGVAALAALGEDGVVRGFNRWRWYGWLGAALLVVWTHYFGLLYVAALALGVAISLRRRPIEAGRVLAAAALAGGSVAAIWAVPFVLQLAAGAYHSWVPVPTPESFIRVWAMTAGPVWLVPGLLLAGLATRSWRGRPGPTFSTQNGWPSLWTALALAAVPVLVYGVSLVGKPLFWPRYFVPLLWVGAAVSAWAATQVFRRLPGRPRAVAAAALFAITGAGWAGVGQAGAAAAELRGGEGVATLLRGLPGQTGLPVFGFGLVAHYFLTPPAGAGLGVVLEPLDAVLGPEAVSTAYGTRLNWESAARHHPELPLYPWHRLPEVGGGRFLLFSVRGDPAFAALRQRFPAWRWTSAPLAALPGAELFLVEAAP